jgi:hypothetical protein
MRPLLLVHGIVSNARHTYGTPGNIFKKPKPGSMFSFLLDQGYQPGKNLFWYTYPTLHPVLFSAQRLKQEIAETQAVSGSQKIDLLTFSLGGIISKYYVVSPLYQNEIQKMIMIAPPFLGSPKADLYKTKFNWTEKDYIFPGDSRALSPQILSTNNPLLTELARHPFPTRIKTAIIAMKIMIGEKKDLLTCYQRLIAAWIGEGDQTVPVESTKIVVNQHYIVAEDYSPGIVHGFLPNHPGIQTIVGRELSDDSERPDTNLHSNKY